MVMRLLCWLCWLPFTLLADDRDPITPGSFPGPKYSTELAALANPVNNKTDFVHWAQANKALLGMSEQSDIELKAAITEPNGYSLYRIQQTINSLDVFGHQTVMLFLHGQPVSAHQNTTALPADAPLDLASWQTVVQQTLKQQQVSYDGTLHIKPLYWRQDDKLAAAAKVDGQLRYQQVDYPYTLFISANGEVLHKLPTRLPFSYKLIDVDQMCSRLGYSDPTTVDKLLQLSNAYTSRYAPAGSVAEASTAASKQLATLFDQVSLFMAEHFGSAQYDPVDESIVFAFVGSKMFHYQQGSSVSCVGRGDNSNAFFAVVTNAYGDYVGLVQVHSPLLQNPEVIMHELAHGIIAFSSELIYQDEPGALNEAFGDIAGVSFVAWLNNRLDAPAQSDWALRLINEVIRDFRAPRRANNNPDHYLDRYVGSKDHGGVHINSSIINHAFYLLAEGGQHRRLAGIEVPKIGMQKALKLWHYASTNIMTPTSDFRDARYAVAEAAEIIYGKYSAERTAVHKAFDAVGVKGSWSENIPPKPVPKVEPKAEPVPLPEPKPLPKAELPPAGPDIKVPPPAKSIPPSSATADATAIQFGLAITGLLLCYGLWLLLKRARPGQPVQSQYQAYQYAAASAADIAAGALSAQQPLLYLHTPTQRFALSQAQLQTEVSVGRATDASITLNHPSVSSKHLRIFQRNKQLFIEDCDSSYGTKIDGKALAAYNAVKVTLPVSISLADLDCLLSAQDSRPAEDVAPCGRNDTAVSQLRLKMAARQLTLNSAKLNGKSFSLGRAADNNCEIAHPAVSSHHGCIFYADQKWFYKDLDSSYGSAIKKQQQLVKVIAGKAVPLDGVAELYLADFCIVIEHDSADGVVTL